MTREHFQRPVQDEEGNLLPGTSIRLLDPGTTSAITDDIYLNGTTADVRTNPWITNDGLIDFYLPKARIVRIGITPPGDVEHFVEDMEVGAAGPSKETFSFTIAGAVAVQTGDLRFYIEDPSQIERVRASVGVAPAGADLKIDVKVNGTSIFTTDPAPTILAGTNTGYVDLSTPFALASGDYVTIDVTSIGSTTPGADLVVQVRIQRL